MDLHGRGQRVRVMGSQSASWPGCGVLWFAAGKAQEQTPPPLLRTELQPNLQRAPPLTLRDVRKARMLRTACEPWRHAV